MPSSATATRCLVALVLVHGLTAWASDKSDWPGWLGPNGNGISPEAGLMDTMPKDGPIQLWSRDIGKGFSSVVVSGGRLFTMDSDKQNEYAICLDASTGKPQWQMKSGALFQGDRVGDGPRATPAISENRVYFLGASGNLLALNAADGQPVWKRDLVSEFKGSVPSWGYSGSPVVAGNRVLVESGATDEPSLLAFDKTNGNLIWASRPGKAGYAPAIVATVGIEQAIFFTGSGPVGLDLENGKELWSYRWNTPWQVNAATPIFRAPDKLFISSNYNKGAALLKIRKKESGYSVQPLWRSKVMNAHFSSPLLFGNHIYGFDDAVLKCIETSSGKLAWEKRGLGKGSLIIADDKLIILGGRGLLLMAMASPDRFVEQGRFQALQGRCWTVPSLADGRLYLRNNKRLLCLDMKKKRFEP